MHPFETKKTTFHFNSDMSGKVIINAPKIYNAE